MNTIHPEETSVEETMELIKSRLEQYSFYGIIPNVSFVRDMLYLTADWRVSFYVSASLSIQTEHKPLPSLFGLRISVNMPAIDRLPASARSSAALLAAISDLACTLESEFGGVRWTGEQLVKNKEKEPTDAS